MRQKKAIDAIVKERVRQDKIWGADRKLHVNLWLAILTEEIGEVARAALEDDRENFRHEVIQVAAVALSMLECLEGMSWNDA